MFECCRKCKPPKRTPGCHDRCPEYKQAKLEYNTKKEEIDRQRRIRNALAAETERQVRKANRGKRRYGRGAGC